MYNKQIVFLATLLWAVHPVNVEPVAWISASKVLVYTSFYLMGLLCYLKYIRTEKLSYYVATLALALCSCLGERTGCGISIMFITGRFCNRQRTVSPENMGRKTAISAAVSLYGNYPYTGTGIPAGRTGLSIDRPGCLCDLFLNRIFDEMPDTD